MRKIKIPPLKWKQQQRIKLDFSRNFLTECKLIGKSLKYCTNKQQPLMQIDALMAKVDRAISMGRSRDRKEMADRSKAMCERHRQLPKKEEKHMVCSQLLDGLQDLIGIFATLFLFAVLFVSCASFTKEGVYIKEADNLKYFSLGSHNRNSVGNRTDLGTNVPIEGIPVRLDVGGNGFLTDKKIRIDKVKDVEYYEVLSRNEDMGDIETAMKLIPKEFFEYSQFGGNND